MKAALAIGLSATAVLVLDPLVASAAWVATNGPAGTQTRALVAAPSRVFAATEAGLFSSVNYSSWVFDAELGNVNVSSLATSMSAPDTLIAGTLGSGIFRSVDDGVSWAASSPGLADPTVRALASVEDPYSGTVYFAGTDAGIFRSFTWGSVWASRGLEAHSVQALTFYYEGDSDEDGFGGRDLLAGTNGGGVFLCWHDGIGWLPKNNNLTNLFITALAASSTYTVTFAGTAGGGVFRSDSVYDGWTPINGGLTNLNVTALATSGSTVLVGTSGGGVFVAANDGDSGFAPINAGLTNLHVTALATNGSFVFAATDAGVFRRALSEL